MLSKRRLSWEVLNASDFPRRTTPRIQQALDTRRVMRAVRIYLIWHTINPTPHLPVPRLLSTRVCLRTVATMVTRSRQRLQKIRLPTSMIPHVADIIGRCTSFGYDASDCLVYVPHFFCYTRRFAIKDLFVSHWKYEWEIIGPTAHHP
jgi:hypothetical protein